MSITANKNCWKFIKLYPTNKRFLENKDIKFIEGKKIITSSKDLAETFNKYYINIKIKKLMQVLNCKKSDWNRHHSPKTYKTSRWFFYSTYNKIINSSVEHNIFPDLAKATLVVALDKGKSNINLYFKFSTFEHFEHLFKNLWESNRKGVISWHGKCFLAANFLIQLIEECRKFLDKDFVIDTIRQTCRKSFTVFRATF